MTLSSWLDIVKRRRRTAALAFLTALATAFGLWLIWLWPTEQRDAAVAYGEQVAETLAVQGMEAMLQPDQLHLSVLTNRVASLPHVRAARFVTVNEELIAETGRSEETTASYSAPVVIDDTVTGYAVVELKIDGFFQTAADWQWWATAAMLLLAPLVAMFAAERWPRRRRRPIPIVEMPEEHPPVGARSVVLLNLYNQLSFPAEMRKDVVRTSLAHAEHVAQSYGGVAKSAQGVGIVLEFSAPADGDDSGEDIRDVLNAISSAYLLSDVLDALLPSAHYRFALHRLHNAGGQPQEVGAELIADVALLASLAKEGTFAATQPLIESLSNADEAPINFEQLAHPMLTDIPSLGEDAYLITTLTEPRKTELRHEANVLLGYGDSIVTESTR